MLDEVTAATPPPPQDSAIIAEDSADNEEIAASDDFTRLKDEYRASKEEPENLLSPEDEQPEPVEAAPEEVEVEEPDLLDEQTGPRTLEALKKQFPRAQTVALEEIARVEAEKWEMQKEFDALSGTAGMEIAKEVMPLLLKANPTEQDGDALLDHLFVTNPALGIEASKLLLDKAFSEDEIDPETSLPIKVATANAMIKKHLDPDYDLAKFEKFIQWDKAGLLDEKDLDDELQTVTETPQVRELRQRLAAIEDKEKQSQAKEENAARLKQRESYDRATGHVSKQVMESLMPIAEQYGWTATKEELNSDKPEVKELAEAKVAMGEFLTAWLNDRMRRTTEWAAVDHLASEGRALGEDGNPTQLFKVNSGPLVNKMIADFKAKVRILNKTFAKSFNSSRTVQLKAKTVQKRPDLETPAVKKAEEPSTDPVEMAKQKYRREMAQIAAQAAG